MNAQSDFLFVIMVVIILALMWLSTGGPERTRNDPGFFLKPPSPLDSGEVYGESLFGAEASDSASGPALDFAKVEEEFKEVTKAYGTSASYGARSPYSGTVHFSDTGYPGATDPAYEYLALQHSGKGGAVALTDWRLESAVSGNGTSIGKGTSLPVANDLSSEGPIVLAPGEQAYITTGRSPIGVSFRPNRCTGYFEQLQDFSPSLPISCPYPLDEMFLADDKSIIQNNACYDAVSMLGACQLHLGSIPQNIPSGCQYFIANDLTYTGCVRKHRFEAGFYSPEWRIYLRREVELWRDRREVIKLLDESGKTVDVYAY